MRIVSVGVPVDELLLKPNGDLGVGTSVEFCGGTHLLRSGHIGDFVIVSEEAIAKGIRRIVALTGPEARSALKRCENYRVKVNGIKDAVKAGGFVHKALLKELNDLFEEIGQAVVPAWRKDGLRVELSATKKELDAADKATKAAKALLVNEKVKGMVHLNPERRVFVLEVDAGNNVKALDAAIKVSRHSAFRIVPTCDSSLQQFLADFITNFVRMTVLVARLT